MSAPLPKTNEGTIKGFGRRALAGQRLRFPWHSLTWQLIFITILPLTVLVLAIAFGSQAIHQNAMRTLVGERDERSVQTAAAALEEQANHRVIAIRSLALLASGVDEQKLSAILSSSDYLLSEFDNGLAFFNSDGILVHSTGDQALWLDLASQITPIIQYQLAQSNSSPYLSSAFAKPLTSEPFVFILAVSPTNDWVAAGAFSTADMVSHTLTNAFAGGSQASIAILDKDKRVLYASGSFSSPSEVDGHPGVAEALNGESGAKYVMVGKNEHVVAYSPIEPLGWALVFEEPWETVATPTLRASQMAPLVVVPVLLLAVVAIWFGARRIVKPLQALESRAATLAWGDFKSIETPVGGIEEIRQLQSELVQMAHKVQSSQKSLHGYIGAITTAQEEERRRLARELHDDTIQALIALKQRVQLAQLSLGSDHHSEQESTSLEEIASLTEQTIENLRRLTRALRPIYLEDLGLVTALEMLARETGQATGIPVEFQRQGVEIRLEPSVELALYRIVQEAFSNIARHAQAKRASLHIHFTAQAVNIEVTDDGLGFDVPRSPAEFAPSGHFGLLGLHERAELIGAMLVIHSVPGKGTILSIHLPQISL